MGCPLPDSAKGLLDRRIGTLESASFWFGVILIAGLFAERSASKDLIIVPFKATDGNTEYFASSAQFGLGQSGKRTLVLCLLSQIVNE
jgi:hypothetical protein